MKEKEKKTQDAANPEETEISETSETLDMKVKAIQEERDQIFARLQRSVADMQNYQKRAVKDRQEAVQRAELGTIERFLFPLIDDLDRALKAASDHGYKKDDPLFHGVNLVLQHAFGQLRQINIEPIEAEGKLFDPLVHEAVMELPEEKLPENTIIQIVTRGYRQEGKTIRPARVVIAKPPKETKTETQSRPRDGEVSDKDKE